MLCARYQITESSQRGEARRAAAAQAQSLGFDEETVGRVALVVSELAGNLVRHVPGGGQLLLRSVQRGDFVSIEVVAIDRGPGLVDHQQALRDGFSTSGTPGTGLGAVGRLSDQFDLHTAPGVGTVIVSRIWRDAQPADPQVAVGAVCATMIGERVPGDAVSVVDHNGRTRVLVADGLGHGVDAEAAAAKAVDVFEHNHLTTTIGELLDTIHRALRATRGAAVSIAEIDPSGQSLQYVGIGNVSGTIHSRDGVRSLVSHNGIVGHTIRRTQEFSYELPAGSVVVLHSDGLKSRWTFDSYAGLLRRDPTVVAAVLFRDFERGRDDATALVART
ncbi:MAG TPA: ATP-binding SpoIIE family protein phosphatase [Solirubrobacteraceae bacterium]